MVYGYTEWVGDKTKEVRKSIGLDQKNMAQRLGISRSALASYEERRAAPHVIVIKKLASFCGMTIDEFLEGCPGISEQKPALTESQEN